MIMAKELIVPLRRGFVKTPRHKRSKKAVSVLRAFLTRHLKADEIKIGQHLNEHVWARGMRNPPGKVAVTAEYVDVDGKRVAQVELQGKKFSESLRPEDRVEEEGGLKGKLQAMTQGKEKAGKEAPEPEKSAEAPEKASEAPKKTPAKTPTKSPAKAEAAEKSAEKSSTPKKTQKKE